MMSSVSQALDYTRLRILLSGKNENHVSALIPERHSFGEGAFPHNPADVDSERRIAPRARRVETLMTEHCKHLTKLSFRLFGRLTGDEPYDSGHCFPKPSDSSAFALCSYHR